MNSVTALLINYTIPIGVSRLTAETIDDVLLRVSLYEAVHGAVLTQGGRPIFITRADIERHVGLETEAPDVPLPTFLLSLVHRGDGPFCVGHLEANGGVSALNVVFSRT